MNERFIPLLFSLLTDEDLRDEACCCLEEIINKGMVEQKKFELLRQLGVLQVHLSWAYSNLLWLTATDAIIPFQVLRSTDMNDIDFAESVAGLVNIIGMQLIQCLEVFDDQDELKSLAPPAAEMIKER